VAALTPAGLGTRLHKKEGQLENRKTRGIAPRPFLHCLVQRNGLEVAIGLLGAAFRFWGTTNHPQTSLVSVVGCSTTANEPFQILSVTSVTIFPGAYASISYLPVLTPCFPSHALFAFTPLSAEGCRSGPPVFSVLPVSCLSRLNSKSIVWESCDH